LRKFMSLEHGIPSHDAFSDLFKALDPASFQQVMLRLVERFAGELDGVIAIDGKCLRRSFCRASGKSPLHLVQAFSSHTGLVLGQIAVDEKSNEITAMPKLLELLDIKGQIVTADAMHTQRASAKAICSKGADYVLALKGNQGTLYDDVKLFLDDPQSLKKLDVFQDVEASHGRTEGRIAHLCDDVGWLQERHDWPFLSAIGKVTTCRKNGTKITAATRYYLLSRVLTASEFLTATRAHWSIENTLHWVLDVTMNEDAMRNRKGNGPENLGLLRRMALNLARSEPSKGSMRGKLKKAGWNDDFILDLIRVAKKV